MLNNLSEISSVFNYKEFLNADKSVIKNTIRLNSGDKCVYITKNSITLKEGNYTARIEYDMLKKIIQIAESSPEISSVTSILPGKIYDECVNIYNNFRRD